jgi:hypothetical protein
LIGDVWLVIEVLPDLMLSQPAGNNAERASLEDRATRETNSKGPGDGSPLTLRLATARTWKDDRSEVGAQSVKWSGTLAGPSTLAPVAPSRFRFLRGRAGTTNSTEVCG